MDGAAGQPDELAGIEVDRRREHCNVGRVPRPGTGARVGQKVVEIDSVYVDATGEERRAGRGGQPSNRGSGSGSGRPTMFSCPGVSFAEFGEVPRSPPFGLGARLGAVRLRALDRLRAAGGKRMAVKIADAHAIPTFERMYVSP